jgi:DNA-binding SARP family transcriptional activator
MEFRILGPLEVVDDGRPVSIRRGKEQALLAYLLLHANEVVPSGRLIDVLWDERPPPTASKILQNAVSHLRKQLGDGRLLTRDPGYILRVEKDELDVQRFEQLAREGRGEEALALWRGPALLNLRDERFADDARRRLEDQRLAVLEDRIERDLAAGRHAELVGELEQLVEQNPLRERLQGQLMRALYGTGRQGDALDVYRRARRTLSEELGLEPGPQLQDLERKILNQDPELAPATRSPPTRARSRPTVKRVNRRFALLALLGLLLLSAAIAGIVRATSGSDSSILATKNSLAVVDPHRGRVVEVIPIGATPRGVTVGKKFVWTANAGEGTVSQIDPKQLRVVQTIGLGLAATDLVEARGEVWVATGSDNNIVRIDARSGGTAC